MEEFLFYDNGALLQHRGLVYVRRGYGYPFGVGSDKHLPPCPKGARTGAQPSWIRGASPRATSGCGCP
jgi:hypothetical protein